MNWKQDKAASDVYLPEIKQILGSHLIGEASLEDDQERNTDLIVLKMDTVRIACRVRTPRYLSYSDEFTIREGRPSGAKAELTKLLEGWGDYIFYGFGDPETGRLLKWTIGDLKTFRLMVFRLMCKNNGIIPGKQQTNRDNSSWFRAYKWAEFEDMIVATGGR